MACIPCGSGHHTRQEQGDRGHNPTCTAQAAPLSALSLPKLTEWWTLGCCIATVPRLLAQACAWDSCSKRTCLQTHNNLVSVWKCQIGQAERGKLQHLLERRRTVLVYNALRCQTLDRPPQTAHPIFNTLHMIQRMVQIKQVLGHASGSACLCLPPIQPSVLLETASLSGDMLPKVESTLKRLRAA